MHSLTLFILFWGGGREALFAAGRRAQRGVFAFPLDIPLSHTRTEIITYFFSVCHDFMKCDWVSHQM